MMYTIPFWKSWPGNARRLFFFCLALFISAVAYAWVSSVRSPAPVLTSERFQHLETKEIPIHEFHVGIKALTTHANSYLVFDHILGGFLHPNLNASYFFLFFLLASVILLLSIITTLHRFWLLAGVGLLIVFAGSLQLETLRPFGMSSHYVTAGILLLYLLAASYFHLFGAAAGLGTRILTFLAITIAVGVVLNYSSKILNPVAHLAANGLIAGIMMAVIFLFMVAHEILAAGIVIVTSSVNRSKSLRHFLLITAIYMVNLGLLYADRKHMIDWHFFPHFILLIATLSAGLGLWGFRQREPLYESILKADPLGVIFYLALAGSAFSTFGYIQATANDPAWQFLQDAMLYSHLGYGLIFTAYIIANFSPMLAENLAVYKVLYKPMWMPYFTFRLAGLIATFAFFAYANWRVSANQIYAGFYNGVGDIYLAQDTIPLAENYFSRSAFYATRNYHAHYALAQTAASRRDAPKEKVEFQKLIDGRPLNLAYLNLSRIYEGENSFSEADLVLRNGLKDFPKDGAILNALSLLYSKKNAVDSAVWLAEASRKYSLSKATPESNLIGLTAKFGLSFPVDSLIDHTDISNPGVETNLLALSCVQQKIIDLVPNPGQDTVLTVYTAASLTNYFLSRLGGSDSSLLSTAIRLSGKPSNSYFKDILLTGSAHALYDAGFVKKAYHQMHAYAFFNHDGQSFDIAGQWVLEQGSPQTAVTLFSEAIENHGDAYFHRAIALTESGDAASRMAWDSLKGSADLPTRHLAEKMSAILAASKEQATAFSDEDKWEFSRHHFTLDQEEDFNKFISLINNPDIKGNAIIDRVKFLDKADEPEMAFNRLISAQGLKLKDRRIHDELINLRLRLLARSEQWAALQEQLQKGMPSSTLYRLDKLFFEALLEQQEGKKEAAEKFRILAEANPFFEDAVIAGVTYLDKQSTDKMMGYSMLVSALELNPNSVKLLKAHLLYAARVGLDEFAQTSLEKLHALLTPKAFIRFAKEHPEVFEIEAH
jgi:hypothetical protein